MRVVLLRISKQKPQVHLDKTTVASFQIPSSSPVIQPFDTIYSYMKNLSPQYNIPKIMKK